MEKLRMEIRTQLHSCSSPEDRHGCGVFECFPPQRGDAGAAPHVVRLRRSPTAQASGGDEEPEDPPGGVPGSPAGLPYGGGWYMEEQALVVMAGRELGTS
ncbi:hypothetical protein CEXT_458081 [Caerostris extrusa]|uniref:Uncharacterized protein n=1 Tax=Caerostris extrusa TaxID=172846 RepID=A0AAV4WV32_CAEEX|nr:hypothetical protein CEXT_458081 [Caerostris extrusa]